MVPVCHVRMSSIGVRASVWIASVMEHWKRLIKIPGDTDCYYCINNMICLIHVYYCWVVLVTVPVILSTIIFSVDFAYLLLFLIIDLLSCFMYTLLLYLVHVTLSVVAYDSCTCIRCIAYMLSSVYLADIITVHTQHRIMVILHMPMCMFTSITSPLACACLSRHH